MILRIGLTAVLAACLALPAAAQITYVDAVVDGMAGTVNTTGSGWTTRGTNGGADTSSFSNEGSALQLSSAPAGETLTTTISGLAPNPYDVFVFFWDDGGGAPADTEYVAPSETNAWDISAQLNGGGYAESSAFSIDNVWVVAAADGSIGATPDVASIRPAFNASEIAGLNVLGQGTDDYTDAIDGNRYLYAWRVGSTAPGSTGFTVDIQGSNLNSQRSWYDGVGYRVVPEPASLGLLACLGLAGVAMRRRK